MSDSAQIVTVAIGVIILAGAIWSYSYSLVYLVHPSNGMPGSIAELLCLFGDLAVLAAALGEILLMILFRSLRWIPVGWSAPGIYFLGTIALLAIPLILCLYDRVYGNLHWKIWR